MEGTSHSAPPTGGFRKTGNDEQYAFKKVNIEERVKVIYIKVSLFFICHIIVIQGITRSEMQSNQVRSVDSAKQ